MASTKGICYGKEGYLGGQCACCPLLHPLWGETIIHYVRQGYAVHIIALTCGTHGESAGYWKTHPQGNYEACAAVRKQESRDAAQVLGATIEFLDWDDYALVIDEKRTRTLIARMLYR